MLLLAFALAFNTILLAPEVHIERVPVNDLAFHIAASQRLGQGVATAEPFLDPWVSEWSLGFPLWRIYQPLPHLINSLTSDRLEAANELQVNQIDCSLILTTVN